MSQTIDKTCPVCGQVYQAYLGRLKFGKQTTCSRKCSYQLRAKGLEVDLSGKRFGKLVVLRRGTRRRYWVCGCDCGREKEIFQSSFVSMRTVSCGCYWKEGRRDGEFAGSEFRSWSSMIARCERSDGATKANYQDRGITICQRWRESFDAFLSDMGTKPTTKHTLERIDNDKGYEPGNCRWATRAEQMRNTRRTIRLTHNGRTMTAKEWAATTGLSYTTIIGRMKLGWPASDIFAHSRRIRQ